MEEGLNAGMWTIGLAKTGNEIGWNRRSSFIPGWNTAVRISGAFGAHGLEGKASARELAAFETGARYQIYHALALVAVAWLADCRPSRAGTIAGWFFVIGTLLFSGSLNQGDEFGGRS